MKPVNLLTFFILLSIYGSAQPWMEPQYLSVNGPQDEWKRNNFFEIEKAFEKYENDYKALHPNVQLRVDANWEEEENEIPGKLYFQRWKEFMEPRVFRTGDITLPLRTSEIFRRYLNSDITYERKTQSAAGNWVSLGPSYSTINNAYQGRINFIKIHPTNSSIYFAGSACGGLWKSVDAGLHWNVINDQMDDLGCSDLAFDPVNPDIMYLASGDADGHHVLSNGIYKSTDGGVTWNITGLSWPIKDNRSVFRLFVNPANSNIIYAGTSLGIYRSTDAGASWQNILFHWGPLYDLMVNPLNPNSLYVSDYFGFYRSYDGGNTFSTDTIGLTGVGKYMIGVSASDTTKVYLIKYAMSAFQGFFQSTDGGITFHLQCSTPNIIGNQGSYDLDILVNPLDASKILVGGIYTYKSEDSGLTWTNYLQSCGHSDIHRIVQLPADTSTVFVCSDGGIVRTTDAGQTWTDLSNGLVVTQVYGIGVAQTEPSIIMEGSQDCGIQRLNASGWEMKFASGDGGDQLIDYSNADIMYLSLTHGKFYKSTNGTTSCTFGSAFVTNTGSGVNSYGYYNTPIVMHPVDPNTILIGKDSVYRSTDGGNTFSSLQGYVGGPVQCLTYAPSDPNHIYLGYSYNFYACTNGNSFTDLSAFLPDSVENVRSIAVSNSDPNKLWIACSGYSTHRVYQSNDGGLTWNDYSAGLPLIPAEKIICQTGTSDMLYLGMDIGVYFRDNTMNSWVLMNNGLPNIRIMDLEIQYSSSKLRAATFGRGVYETDLMITDIKNQQQNNFVVNIYPNPANNFIKIATSGAFDAGNLFYELYNSYGEVISRNTISTNVKELDLSNLTAGIYILKIQDNNRSVIQKVILE